MSIKKNKSRIGIPILLATIKNKKLTKTKVVIFAQKILYLKG